jgi:Flp pilus assembly protein protease CpaA
VIARVHEISVVACVLLAAVGAWTDFRTRQIPNWLTLGGIVFGIALQAFAGHHQIERAQFGGQTPQGGIGHALLGAVVCSAPFIFLFYKQIQRDDGSADHVSGGGDAKIIAAMGAILGLYDGLELTFLCMAATAVLTLARLAWHGRLLRVLSNSLFLVLNPILPKRWQRRITAELLHKVRLGIPMFVGTLMFAINKLAW